MAVPTPADRPPAWVQPSAEVETGAVPGDRCKVQNNVSLHAGVVPEDRVFCGPRCVSTNGATPRAEIERKVEFCLTRVGRGATIAANGTIVWGHDLGAWRLIAVGAVVTHDAPPFAQMAGVLGADLVCLRTGDRYTERSGALRRVINVSGFGEDPPDNPNEEPAASVG